ncbi:MAG: ABC transporter permease subunit [Acidobacteriota bacterium]|nr:ABC transporter permease subunit [Acidobacteriota bacterium]
MAPTLARSAPAFVEPRLGALDRWRFPLGLMVVVVLAGWNAHVDLRLLVSHQTWASITDLLVRLFPPDLSFDFLKIALHATLTTAATAVVATVISASLAIPLGVLASGRLWRTGIAEDQGGHSILKTLSWLTLHGMGVIRSVPDLVWALLFVAGLGLGPLPGTLALAISYTALLGRVYADIFDEASVKPLEALRGLGATRLQVLLFGILPQSRAMLTSYTLYSFECCVRSAAVLGFVGAGGLGYEISLSTRLFEFSQVLTLMGCFVLLLFLVDLLSRAVRARIVTRPEAGDAGGVFNGRLRRRFLIGASLLAALFASLPVAGIRWANFTQSDTLHNLLRFARLLFRPEWSPAFLREVGLLALQTISISILGTVTGAMLGLMLAFPATRLRGARHESLERSWLVRLRGEVTFWLARMVSNLLRATPELVWVLICVIAVGFGPFAGSIALGLHTGGVLGKLFAETMEESPQEQVEAMLAFGATPFQCLFWALLPQSWPMMRRYILLRWDMNLRAATILGLVGGGGLGQALYNDVQLGDYSKVSTLIAAVIVLVVGSDWLSQPSARMQMQT